MGTRTFYCWKISVNEDGESFLIDPWSDPFEYEHPFNFQFDSEEEARRVKESDDFGHSSEEKDWILIKVTETVELV